MGQGQSAEDQAPGRSKSVSSKEKRVTRRTSNQGLGHTRAHTDAGTSGITAQVMTTYDHANMTNAEKLLHASASPNRPIAKFNRIGKASPKTEISTPVTNNTPTSSTIAKTPSEEGQASSIGIDIPTNKNELPVRSRREELEDVPGRQRQSQSYTASYMPMSAHRPPRLPLPIVDTHTQMPGSPNLMPVEQDDSDVPVFSDDAAHDLAGSNELHRRDSVLSHGTQDEDHEEAGDELLPFGMGIPSGKVPYDIVWTGGGEKVFVTGTFAAWDKKYRLRRSDSDPSLFKVTLHLPPGTHHLKFFVDNQMVTSADLPTAVDFSNILVNYIEIPYSRETLDLPDDPASVRDRERRTSSQGGKPTRQSFDDDRDRTPGETEDNGGTTTPGDVDDTDTYSDTSLPPEETPEGDFRAIIPQALLDIDLDESDPRYKMARQVLSDVSAPPSLPLFLSRSVLNGTLALKDDCSVLALPNHTVLNHLMTSNVRNGVGGWSCTTRYRRKYVTTISFKAVPRTLEPV